MLANSRTIGEKLYAGVGVLLLLTVLEGGVAVWGSASIQANIQEVMLHRTRADDSGAQPQRVGARLAEADFHEDPVAKDVDATIIEQSSVRAAPGLFRSRRLLLGQSV